MSLMQEGLTRNTIYIMWPLEIIVVPVSNELWDCSGSSTVAKQYALNMQNVTEDTQPDYQALCVVFESARKMI